MLSSRLVGLVFGAALSIYAIRQLSVADWGHYSAIVSLVAIFGIFTEAGVSSLTVREIATHPERAPAVLSLATSAVALSAFVSLLLMLAVSFVLGYAMAWPALVALGACLVATQGLAVPLYAIFNARRAFSYTAVIAGVVVPVAAVIGAPLVALGLGPPALLIGALVGQLTSAVVGHALVRKRLGMSLGLRWPRGPTLRFMQTAAPIAATGGLTIVYQRLDILMLSKLAGAAEVAAYAVPYSLLQYSWMVPSAVAAAFFPVLSDTLRRDAERARYLFFLLVRLFFLAIVPGAIFLAVASKPILTTVFGDKYAESASTLAILAAVVVLAAQNYVLWYGIFAGRKEGLVVGVQVAGLAVNAALNLALIPAFGAEGAASALVVSELVVTAGQAWIVHRWVFPIPWAAIFVRLLLASAAAAVVIVALLPVGRLVAAVVGPAACLLVLVVTGYVPRHEWAPLREPVRKSIARWRTASARP